MKFKKLLIPLVLVSFMTACADGTSTSENSISSGSQTSSSTNEEQGDKVLQSALAKLKQDVAFNGSYELTDSTATYVHEVTAIFTETKYLSRDVYYDSELPELRYQTANDILSYEDGSIYLIMRNIDNSVIKIDLTEDYAWNQFQNPFFEIEETDFTFISKGKYSLDLTKGLDVGIAISGWEHTSCKTFNIEVLENTIELQFVLVGVDGEVTYNFVASKFGTATVETEPFEHESAHDKLGNALASIGENYTMHILDQAYNDYDEDVNQTIYKTETHYFDEFEQVGYRKVDGAVKEYSLTDGEVTKYEDADEYNPFENLLELNAIAPEIFEEIEPNVFVIKDLELAYDVVAAFSNNSDNKLLGYYFALDAKITLTNEGTLDKFEYNYDAYGFASHRTVTFENVDSTVIPGYVEDALEAYEQEQQNSTIPTKYIGNYEGTLNGSNIINGSNSIRVEITENEIKVNDLVAEIEEYDDYEGFTIVVDGTTYYLCTTSYEEEEHVQNMSIFSSDYQVYSYNIERKDEPTESIIPAKFIGKFEGVLDDGAKINGSNKLQIEITRSEIIINGLVAEIVEYDLVEDFTLLIDDVTFYLGANDYENPTEGLWFFDEDYTAYCYDIPRVDEFSNDDSSIIPTKFIGKFEGILNEGDTTVTINGSNKLQIEVTNNEIIINGLVAEIVEYDLIEDFTISIDGVTYYLGANDYVEPTEGLWFSDEDYTVYCYDIPRVDEFSSDSGIIPSKFIGTFEGILNEGDAAVTINGSNTLVIEITKTQIIINGIVAEIVEYDPVEDFTILVDDVTYYLGANDYEDQAQGLWFADENFEVYCYEISRI
ncbi:MAG: hypothetical protein J1F32_02265 [Erysipelotrichales bacterium]|nr:hypothetical protein [Erysipelotrichales bacterium]